MSESVPTLVPGTNGPITFIVRVSINQQGDVTAVVQRVRTGQKEPVHSVDGIGRAIATMIAARGETP